MEGYFLMKALCDLSMLLVGVGAILFILWAHKNLDKKKLKKLSTTLLVVGILGGLFAGSMKMKMKEEHKMELSAEDTAAIQEVLTEYRVRLSDDELQEVMEKVHEVMRERKRSKKW